MSQKNLIKWRENHATYARTYQITLTAQNNKEAHPYPCRIFTLKESFWFALTSFTPQGGGEAPKSLSGRVLVAAYWLFVVLVRDTT